MSTERETAMVEYKVVSRWAGWFGGWGSESDLGRVVNGCAGEGYRLVSTKAWLAFWWFAVPRKKLLLVFEREQNMVAHSYAGEQSWTAPYPAPPPQASVGVPVNEGPL